MDEKLCVGREVWQVANIVRSYIAAKMLREGFGKKVRGHILLTDHKDPCWFRNLKIRVLD